MKKGVGEFSRPLVLHKLHCVCSLCRARAGLGLPLLDKGVERRPQSQIVESDPPTGPRPQPEGENSSTPARARSYAEEKYDGEGKYMCRCNLQCKILFCLTSSPFCQFFKGFITEKSLNKIRSYRHIPSWRHFPIQFRPLYEHRNDRLPLWRPRRHRRQLLLPVLRSLRLLRGQARRQRRLQHEHRQRGGERQHRRNQPGH